MSERVLNVLKIVLRDFVPDQRLSLNGRNRLHFRTVMALRDATKLQVIAALLADGGPPPRQYAQALVRIVFVYRTHRRRDPDNLAGLAKPILDALVTAKILTDDDCDHIELLLAATVEPGGRETRIWITERDV